MSASLPAYCRSCQRVKTFKAWDACNMANIYCPRKFTHLRPLPNYVPVELIPAWQLNSVYPPVTENDVMPFGVYGHNGAKGPRKIKDVPASYLLWLWETAMKNLPNPTGVAAYIRDNLKDLKTEANQDEKENGNH